jgi:acyl-CoA thioester hydrolase
MTVPATVHRHHVRYHEMDAQGIVFNGRYWEFFDVAMGEFFRELGWTFATMEQEGLVPSLVHVEADFTNPATLDDELDIAVRCLRVGRTSFQLGFEVHRADGLPLTSASIVYVNFDSATHASRPIPDVLRTQLAGRLAGADAPEAP